MNNIAINGYINIAKYLYMCMYMYIYAGDAGNCGLSGCNTRRSGIHRTEGKRQIGVGKSMRSLHKLL